VITGARIIKSREVREVERQAMLSDCQKRKSVPNLGERDSHLDRPARQITVESIAPTSKREANDSIETKAAS
jgi:hypothetical protein